MITRPLDLESGLSPPPRDFTAIAWVNAVVIVLFFSVLGSRFVLAPGVLMGAGGAGFGLPATAGLQNVPTAPMVVNYQRDGVILFEGAFVTLSQLRERLAPYARQHPGEVLLLVADRQVSVNALAELSAMVQSIGFAYVHVAAEPEAPEGARR